MRAPCPTCPWRRSSAVGGGDIPGFSIDLMRGLANTVGPDDDFRPIMACHGSACGGETACVGYVAVEGISNLNVRLAAAQGRLDYSGMVEGCEGLDLWPSFGDMLAAYEEASIVSEYIAGPVERPDGRAAWVIPLTFGRARIVIGQPESPFLDDGW